MMIKTSLFRILLLLLITLVVWTSRISVIPNSIPTEKPNDNITINYINELNSNNNNNTIDYTNPNLRGSAFVESKIRKTSFSNKNRLIIIAGLEGTGHHALTTMFDICINITTPINSSYIGRCLPVPELSNTLMFNNITTRNGLFFSNDAKKAGVYLRKVKEIMASLNIKKEHDNLPTLYILGCDHPTTSGMLSYPNFGDPQKSLNHPDVAVLARLAELVKIDFRIIVLQRSADNILMSTKNRRFGGPKEGRTLSDNAAALYSQLKLLDPKFFHCIQYQELSVLSENKKNELIDFTHPLLQSILPQMLETVRYKSEITTSHNFIKTMNNRSHNNNQNYFNEMRTYIKTNYDVHSIAARLQLIDNLCSKY